MTGNEFGVQDTKGSNAPPDSLAVAYEVVHGTTDDEFIEQFGVGNYTRAEKYQQLHRYPNVMFEAAAWGDRLKERAFWEARQEIVEGGLTVWKVTPEGDAAKRTIAAWDELDEERRSKFDNPEEYAEEVLQELPEVRRYKIVQDLTGFQVGDRGPNRKMMEMANEIGRSEDGLLLNNLTSNVHEYRGQQPAQGRTRK